MMRPRVPSSNLSAGEACRWIRDAAVVTLSAAEYAGKAGPSVTVALARGGRTLLASMLDDIRPRYDGDIEPVIATVRSKGSRRELSANTAARKWLGKTLGADLMAKHQTRPKHEHLVPFSSSPHKASPEVDTVARAPKVHPSNSMHLITKGHVTKEVSFSFLSFGGESFDKGTLAPKPQRLRPTPPADNRGQQWAAQPDTCTKVCTRRSARE
ncbi:hypothetical protein B0T13DRAFT_504473 [Neurospora crassa]|nr:hypothetical protein B0T13DRAFT_504473 [Neurospora crassa]